MTRPRPAADPDAARARALADPSRRRLLERLGGRAMTVSELAAALGMHPNAVRQHLAVLHECDLVDVQPDETDRAGRPGRPARRYRRAPGRTGGDVPFERLARLLAPIAEGADVADVAAAEAGRLLEARPGVAGAALAVDVATDHGFAPTVTARDRATTAIRLDRCPYAALAGPVVCELHRAVLDRLVAGRGGALTSFTIAPPPAGRCHFTIDSQEDPR